MTRKLFVIIGFALVALAIGACGGGDDNKSSATAAATQATSTSGGGSTKTAAVTATQESTADTETPGPTSTNNGGGTNASCELLTTAEVAAALGQTMKDGFEDSSSSVEKPECEWDPVDEATVATVYLSVYGGGSSGTAESDYEILDANSEQISGLGDKAHWISGIDLLEVLTGNRNLAIQVVYFQSDHAPKDVAVALARKALDRLP